MLFSLGLWSYSAFMTKFNMTFSFGLLNWNAASIHFFLDLGIGVLSLSTSLLITLCWHLPSLYSQLKVDCAVINSNGKMYPFVNRMLLKIKSSRKLKQEAIENVDLYLGNCYWIFFFQCFNYMCSVLQGISNLQCNHLKLNPCPFLRYLNLTELSKFKVLIGID